VRHSGRRKYEENDSISPENEGIHQQAHDTVIILALKLNAKSSNK
jgi:hypothetical protein